MKLNFYDEYFVEIRGERGVAEKLKKTYQHFAVSDSNREPDLVCEVTTEEPELDTVLGGPDDHYGRAGDRFVIRKWEDFMSIDSDWSHIYTNPDNIHHHIAYIIEFEVRKRMAEEKRAIIHASGVQIDGKTLLFPAWRYTGKTNTMITLLRAGGDYLSDDRVWVDTDGTVQGYPLPVNMMPSNIESFPHLATMTSEQRARTRISEFIYDTIEMDRSLVDKVLYFLTEFYIENDFDRELLTIDELVPGSRYVESADIDGVILLRTTFEHDRRVEIEELPAEEAATDLSTISYYEWNERLMESFRAFDSLFSSSNRTEELDSLMDAEDRIFLDVLETVPTYRAHIPREKDWTETGIEDEIRRKFPDVCGHETIQPHN